MTPEKLSRWKKLAEAATEGPWIVCAFDDLAPDGYSWMFRGVGTDVYAKDPHNTVAGNNQDFTAEARTAVPELIAEVERLQRIIRWADEVKPCAVCGSKLMWAYAGDATFATECKTGERHKCPMHE